MTAPFDIQETPPSPNTAAFAVTYVAATTALRSRLLGIVAALYGQGDYRDADAAAFVTAVLPVALAAQRTMAALTDAYLTHLIAAGAGGSSAPVGVAPELVTGKALRGADPAAVYRRPYVQVWTSLSQGKPFDQAVAAGARRAESIAATDLQLAKTHTARLVMGRDDRVVGYRRVLNGPLSCALCVIASTQRYHKSDLLPIHPSCDCGISVITSQWDPGRVLDDVTVNNLHKTVERDLGAKYVDRGGRGLVHYRDIVVTHNHSELGSVLGVRGQRFTSPSDLPHLSHDSIGADNG